MHLSRNVKVLSWVSLFQDAASEMLYPILPIFLSTVLGAPPAAIGLVEGTAEATAAILKGVSGRLADRVARKPLIAFGYGLSSISKGLIGLATIWPHVLLCRALDRVGKGVRGSPRDALIVADTSPEQRGRAFGYHRAFDTAGAIIGPLLGLALYQALHHQLRPLFALAVIPALISTALTGFVRESNSTSRPQRSAAAPEVQLPRAYWQTVAMLGAFALFNFTDALIILRLHSLGLSLTYTLLAYTAYNVSYAGLSYPAGALSDRLSKPVVFAVGVACFAIAYLGFGLAQSALWCWPLLLIYGAYAAMTDGVGKAWISTAAPKAAAGRAQGYFQSISGIGSLAAGLWAGLLWGSAGRTPFLISGSAAAILACLLLVMLSNPPKALPA